MMTTEEDPDKRYLAVVKKHFNNLDFDQLYEVIKAAFPPKRRESLDFFRKIFQNKRGIFLITKDKKKRKIIGYMISLPLDDAFNDYLKEYDPNLRKDSTALYIESSAIIPEEQRRGHYSRMFKRLVKEARCRGYKKITAHDRSKVFMPLRDKYGARKIHTIQNGFNYDESYDYLEYEIKAA